ncbi:MAG: exosortase/archaeosortase family protein [Terriglobales bacterium]
MRTKLIPARDLLFFALVAAPVLVCWREILTVLLLAWHVDEYTHILLIVPVSVALIYLERGKLRRNAGYAPIAGMLVGSLSIAIMVGLKTHMLGSGEGSLTIAIFSLVLFWMAAIVGCFGMDVFRALMFPFLFLFLLVPPPMFVLDKAILFLQSASTVATYDVFKLTGLPVLKSGFILTFPTLQIEVAKECSGIRSSIMLLLTGLILAHLFLRSFWSKVVFVLLILPLSVIKNAIRIFTLSMLGMYVDPGFLRGRLHHEGGIVFFLIALAGLLFFLWILQRAGGTRAQPDSSVTPA